MIRSLSFIAVLALVSPLAVTAQGCPANPDIEVELDGLFAQVQAAETDQQARALTGAFWALWTKAPDPLAQDLLDEGMAQLRVADFDRAEKALTTLIKRCPNFAEGYNQRAYLNYLRQDFAAALPDLDKALALQPRHTGALTGKSLTLVAMGRPGLAQPVLREAVRLNPWLSERHLLVNETDL